MKKTFSNEKNGGKALSDVDSRADSLQLDRLTAAPALLRDGQYYCCSRRAPAFYL